MPEDNPGLISLVIFKVLLNWQFWQNFENKSEIDPELPQGIWDYIKG